eukprot:TRINITY_DN16620_c0_g1_i3.p1 TRINITY_DN16620_c0_g1~~TRINITY_DN16620_c0_g1_i3.p1  ORF type:complete len:478 (-),score=64.47 TRINITY_DN16620_c0_g1_i3:192-1625(-)
MSRFSCRVMLLAAAYVAAAAAVDASSPPCLRELSDLAVTPDGNPALWELTHNVSNPEWDGRLPAAPAFVVLPRTAQDVQRCLKCAMEQRLHVAVKGGGHSFGGYSSLPASKGFMMNMRNMATVSPVLEQPDAAVASVKLQGGARWRDVYHSFKISGKEWVVNGGLCPSVGVAGFTMGGGVGPAARRYGLGVDGVVSFTMVTADGQHVVTVNDTSHADLFWALRGAGGGNFGVVTDLEVRVHPGPDLFAFGRLCYAWNATELLLKDLQANAALLPRTVNVDIILSQHSGACLWIASMEPLAKTRQALAALVPSMTAANLIVDSLKEWNCWWEGITAYAVEHGYGEYDSDPYYSKNCLIDSISPGLVATLKKLTEAAPPGCTDSQHFIAFGGKVKEVAANATSFPWRSIHQLRLPDRQRDIQRPCTQVPERVVVGSVSFLQRWQLRQLHRSPGEGVCSSPILWCSTPAASKHQAALASL